MLWNFRKRLFLRANVCFDRLFQNIECKRVHATPKEPSYEFMMDNWM